LMTISKQLIPEREQRALKSPTTDVVARMVEAGEEPQHVPVCGRWGMRCTRSSHPPSMWETMLFASMAAKKRVDEVLSIKVIPTKKEARGVV
jgi:hypothetical protein